jgi:nicotinamidase-related amidase
VFECDPKRTAIIGIDLQNWTLGLPVAPRTGDEVVSAFVQIARTLKSAGGTVVLSRAAFSPGYADLLQAPVDVPLRVPEGGIPETALAFKPEIAALDADIVVTKRQWSAFFGTELDLQLRRRNIDTLIVGGVMTNFGVESTARDGWQNN